LSFADGSARKSPRRFFPICPPSRPKRAQNALSFVTIVTKLVFWCFLLVRRQPRSLVQPDCNSTRTGYKMNNVATAVLQTMFVTLPTEKGKKFNKIEKSDFANKNLLRRFSFPRIRCTFVSGKERNFSNYNQ
jgi:hypothetical protein